MKAPSVLSSLLLHHHRLLQQVGHRRRRLRPHRQPLLDGGRVEGGLLLQGVIKAQPLQGAPLPLVARVDGDEAEEGGFGAAKALEAQLWWRERSVCVCG